MTDDQFWRILIGGGVFAALGAFKGQIMRFLYRIGYRDWRHPHKKDPF